jgi:hypothetical protein
MKLFAVVVMMAACGGAGSKPTGPRAEAYSLDQMVHGLPENTDFVASLDIKRLKQAPAIQKLWSIVTGTPALYAAIGTQSCIGGFAGVALDADEVLVGGELPANVFGWMRGATRSEYEECRNKPENKRLLLQAGITEVVVGDFVTLTLPGKINQYVWLAPDLLVTAMQRKTPATEEQLRGVAARARTPGAPLANAALRDLYDKVDRTAPIWIVMESPRFGNNLHGGSLSVTFGDKVTASVRALCNDAERVRTLVERIEEIGQAGKMMGIVASVETRSAGLEVFATFTVGPEQLEKLVILAKMQLGRFQSFEP